MNLSSVRLWKMGLEFRNLTLPALREAGRQTGDSVVLQDISDHLTAKYSEPDCKSAPAVRLEWQKDSHLYLDKILPLVIIRLRNKGKE